MWRLESDLKADGAFVAVGSVRLFDDVGMPAMLAPAGLRVDLICTTVTDQRRRVALAGSMCLVSFSASGA